MNAKESGRLPLVESRTGQCHTVNEDRFLCDADLSLYAVLDGQGEGGYAADLAVEGLQAFGKTSLGSRDEDPPEIARALVAAVHAINRRVFESNTRSRHGCGTTLACCTLVGQTAVVAHVGDSRLFLRQGDAWRLVTTDHSMLEDWRRSGSPIPPDFRSSSSNIITRAVGVAATVQVDVLLLTVSPGDCVLLCTDGAWRPFDPDYVGAPPPAAEPTLLVNWIFEQYALQGEHDNATVLLAAA